MRAADPDQVPRPLIPLLLQLERPGAAQLEEAWLVSQTFGDKEDVAYAAAPRQRSEKLTLMPSGAAAARPRRGVGACAAAGGACLRDVAAADPDWPARPPQRPVGDRQRPQLARAGGRKAETRVEPAPRVARVRRGVRSAAPGARRRGRLRGRRRRAAAGLGGAG